MEMNQGMVPVYEVNKGEGDHGFGGGYMWIFFLFFLLAWGGNGFGGFGGGAGTTANFVNNDFLYTNLNNTIDRGFNQIAQMQYGNTKDMLQGFNTIGQQVAGAQYAAQQCCCETNRNIDQVRYQMAQDTCAITTNATANTQHILDKLCAMEAAAKDQRISDLQLQLQAAQLQLGNAAQTQNIISQVRPFPVPAYPVSSPYVATNACNACVGC